MSSEANDQAVRRAAEVGGTDASSHEAGSCTPAPFRCTTLPIVPGLLRPVGPSFVCEYEFHLDLPDSLAYTFELDDEEPLVVSRSELASMDWKLVLMQFEH